MKNGGGHLVPLVENDELSKLEEKLDNILNLNNE